MRKKTWHNDDDTYGSTSTHAKCCFVFTSAEQDEMKVELSGSLSHRTWWSRGGRCFWGSVCSNDAVCWAGNGAVIPGYSPQWRTLIGWLILVCLYYRILKAEPCLIPTNLPISVMCYIIICLAYQKFIYHSATTWQLNFLMKLDDLSLWLM